MTQKFISGCLWFMAVIVALIFIGLILSVTASAQPFVSPPGPPPWPELTPQPQLTPPYRPTPSPAPPQADDSTDYVIYLPIVLF